MLEMQRLAGALALLIIVALAHPCIGDTAGKAVVVFKGGHTAVPYEESDGRVTRRKPLAFRVPALVGGVFENKEFFMVICDARYNGFSDRGFIEPVARTSYGNYKQWSEANIVVKSTRRSAGYSVVGNVTAVMKGNKIYAFAQSLDEAITSGGQRNGGTGWAPLMLVGTVTNLKKSGGDGMIVNWEKRALFKNAPSETGLGPTQSRFTGGAGNGVVTKSGAIVFPIQVENKNKNVAASIMYSTNDGSSWQLGEMTDTANSEGSVVEWGAGKLLLFTRYDKGYRKAYESDDMGATWKESSVFSRVWGNEPNRYIGTGSQGSAITAPVDGKDVLLFAHPLNEKGGRSFDTLQLWVSDGQRIARIGTISEDGKGERSGHSILAHVGQSLYVTHEINPYGENQSNTTLNEWDRVIAFNALQDFFERVKKTVRLWRQLDAWIRSKGTLPDGLVGFLGNTKTDDVVWADWYNCVNATVKGGTRVQGGFRFNGAVDSGAQWPVRTQGQNQVYIFTDKQFTFAATVQIHQTNGADYESLLGATGTAYGSYILVGIGCTKDKKWYVLHGLNVKMKTELSLDLEKEYHVAFTFANEVAYVYVDGVEITQGKVTTRFAPNIHHFFMGVVGFPSSGKGSLFTAKNVMLFNRALTQEEIAGISKMSRDGKLDEGTWTPDWEETGSGDAGKSPNGKGNGKGAGHYLHGYRNGVFRKDHKRADGAAVPFSCVACMCFAACIAVVLTGI